MKNSEIDNLITQLLPVIHSLTVEELGYLCAQILIEWTNHHETNKKG